VGVTPELSFKHMISLSDSRFTNTPDGESADGAAISVQLANAAGVPVGDWIKMSPFLNVYDAQRSNNFTNCFFDPTDDGNTEDDFFDPTDPDRVLGPSTMCFPEFSYVWMGSTVGTFSESNLGNAEGPGLQGNKGEGTWVETKVNFSRFKGRAVRIRFINSAIKAGTAETAEDLFEWNPIEADDGWWVDEVRISDTLTSGATVSVDNAPNTGLPGCAGDCTSVTAALVADPPGVLPAPGQVVELNAATSVANSCLGTLQYQFSKNGTVIRTWTDNPILVDAPSSTTTYGVEARCTSAPGCDDSVNLLVQVTCPASGNLGGPFPNILAPDKNQLIWSGAQTYNYGNGLLSALSTSYPTIGTGTGVGPATSHSTAGTPPANNGWWWLFRIAGGGGTYCNETSTYGSAPRDAVLP
jgi:hypothetical protein